MLEKMKMIWQDAKQLKDERGLTLVELLVVVVILGIIAAIAVVAIGGIIENSRKDAMVADARQMVSAAKLYTASNPVTAETVLEFTALEANSTNIDMTSYLSDLKDPLNSSAAYDDAIVFVSPNGGKYEYRVFLDGKNVIGGNTKATAELESALSKKSIK
ncbi:prepilin-type N-terminal cleavage/methylation domain-containing protein [Exiguobacterium sp. SH5S4]|uniref:prepilin-type N-terminal cleavage/methylation domain-containing protein n=1 Tax=Exiguobacterium sp. SH5S4 TaxID=2510961 RepID=UPI00103940A0|nr:prepilin-type N-terminal cleavage/methylation domain-containing protein [Exiguobacterium sp. SH5S4]TCI24523.1 prepilin-type N-terminal cleavage/methylation domain-containing protein [Exiguobacterium sp. SH5S4]